MEVPTLNIFKTFINSKGDNHGACDYLYDEDGMEWYKSSRLSCSYTMGGNFVSHRKCTVYISSMCVHIRKVKYYFLMLGLPFSIQMHFTS